MGLQLAVWSVSLISMPLLNLSNVHMNHYTVSFANRTLKMRNSKPVCIFFFFVNFLSGVDVMVHTLNPSTIKPEVSLVYL